MRTRITPIRIVSFALMAVCVSFCQKRPSADLRVQLTGFDQFTAQRQKMHSWNSLPDAPSWAHAPSQAEQFHMIFRQAGPALALGAAARIPGLSRQAELAPLGPGLESGFAAKVVFTPKDSNAFFSKYLSPPSLKQAPVPFPINSEHVVGRATYAASRILITRDSSGSKRLNSSYFLGVLSSVAIHSAYRPYWARSASAAFHDAGSTIGGDAGTNVLHEFEPDLLQVLKHVTPRFVFQIEDRILAHAGFPRNSAAR
jgi:hypothetical protein